MTEYEKLIERKFSELLRLQNSFNNTINPNWKKEDPMIYDPACAIMVEGAEAIDSLSWKWWKKMDSDMDNFGVEIVDILHFLMHQHLVKYSDAYLSELYLDMYTVAWNWDDSEWLEGYTLEDKLKALTKRLVLFTLKYNLEEDSENNLREQVFNFMQICKLLKWDINDIHSRYIVKNVLNKVRQENGYKSGTYRKMWIGSDGKEYEDNVIAFEMMRDIPEDADSFDWLYTKLTEYYLTM